MLEAVSVTGQWNAIESKLPTGWGAAHLRVRISDPAEVPDAVEQLRSVSPVQRDDGVDLHVTPTSRTQLRWALGRLEKARIHARLELVGSEAAAPVAGSVPAQSLAGEWEREEAALPEDWSDVLARVDLASSDHLARAALAMAPLNPTREEVRALRFRCARRSGYGAAPSMVRRCLERLDEEGIGGRLEILRALSETDHVSTQGPVWYVGGKVL
jgi:hypothetical protein